MPPWIDLTGKRFGRLTVVRSAHRAGYRNDLMWLCRCDCGKEITTQSQSLRNKRTRSCGCLAHDQISTLWQRRAWNGTHGHSRRGGTPTYRSWSHMLQRCDNPKHHAYADYGGRGISVAPQWRDNFEAFLSDMGERPENTTLDRIDNNGSYEPGNCRWATRAQQGLNTRTSGFFLDLDGNAVTIETLAHHLAMNASWLAKRFRRAGVLA